ncbi:UNVERIFIED_CONTAM: hypothetical protein Sradi_6423900 [Sesamum radiatum]|uniref:Integrase catalytic domain-containing protein n=1 Tax=Sesamum radiatum TaxID=300843 RepID=A0AAW2K419_SESRA
MKRSKPWKKLILGFVVLTNRAKTTFSHKREWVIIGLLWSKIAWIMQEEACQFANLIHQPPEPLHTVASWPFDALGLDVVGPLTKSSGGHLYILAATDYFSKWAEAVPLKEVKKENVAYFIYRYRVPRYIITDNGKPFCKKLDR